MLLEAFEVDFLHNIGTRMASGELHEVVDRVVEFVTGVVKCDSCLVYLLEGNDLVLRASKNPHPDVVDRLKLPMGKGITGWVAEHREPVAIRRNASQDPRFQFFHELPEDEFEAFLSVPILCRDRVVGVINVQHRLPHIYRPRQIRLISTIGFLVGAIIELARLESENLQLAEELETRKLVERAEGILQRDLKLTEEEAYLTLQRESRQRRRPMKDVADAILLSDDLRRPARAESSASE
ncbi:MAG: GAF domain-containing protein [Terriglobia bacterium]|jgi:uroporphyrinogen-III synthase